MRDKIIKRILIVLRDGYNKHNDKCSNNNGETQEGTPYDRRGSEYLRSTTRGGLLSDTRYSLPDMPFFEDNGDIASFEAMTPEERLNTLLSETEDVARENQIFLREGAEMAMAEKKKSADETVSPNNSDHSTAISSADGAKVLKKLDNLAKKIPRKTKPTSHICWRCRRSPWYKYAKQVK